VVSYDLRAACGCGGTIGYVVEKNGQALVFCGACDRWQYNAPKKERGLAPSDVRRDGVTPSVRYRVMERARLRCEFCGASAAEGVMHIGHLLSVEDCRGWGIPDRFVDNFANLAWLCDACNLGMGKRSLELHEALVFLCRRADHDLDGVVDG